MWHPRIGLPTTWYYKPLVILLFREERDIAQDLAKKYLDADPTARYLCLINLKYAYYQPVFGSKYLIPLEVSSFFVTK